jgi:hypothetical protein
MPPTPEPSRVEIPANVIEALAAPNAFIVIRIFFICMGLLSFFFGGCSKPAAPPASKFHAGQIWAFTPPTNQPNAKLTVLRVEDGGKLGTIVHVAISDVMYGNGQTQINHMPFAEAAVERSITTLERESGPVPDFLEGYRQWRKAYDAGKGGIFTISVAEAFDAVTSVARERK